MDVVSSIVIDLINTVPYADDYVIPRIEEALLTITELGPRDVISYIVNYLLETPQQDRRQFWLDYFVELAEQISSLSMMDVPEFVTAGRVAFEVIGTGTDVTRRIKKILYSNP